MMISSVGITKTTKELEVSFWRNVGVATLLAIIGALGGDIFESYFFPVIKRVELGEPRIVPDGRLCWSFKGVKTRWATGTTFAAQVYESDLPEPTHRELTHMDDNPYGGSRAGFAPAPFSTEMCVRIDHIKGPYSRIGVRVLVEFQLDAWRPYLIRQPEIWRDFYPDDPATK